MTALELANWLNDYGSQYAGSTADKAADMLRRQHEAIVKLRSAAKAIIDYGNSKEASLAEWPEWDAKYDALEQALKDTDGL